VSEDKLTFKEFKVGDELKIYTPLEAGRFDCQNKLTGKIKLIYEGGYIVETGDRLLAVSTMQASEANGGHYCKLGPCAYEGYECEHLEACRSCQ